jgi:predicted RNA-binding Zn-ribbon protein involved in translation (DUF1610 family)
MMSIYSKNLRDLGLPTTCPVCGIDEVYVYHSEGESPRVRCSHCRKLFREYPIETPLSTILNEFPHILGS